MIISVYLTYTHYLINNMWIWIHVLKFKPTENPYIFNKLFWWIYQLQQILKTSSLILYTQYLEEKKKRNKPSISISSSHLWSKCVIFRSAVQPRQPRTEPKCTEFNLKKSPDLSHLGPIWPTLGPNLVTLHLADLTLV